jgi:DNA-binding IclR family transcriptional regulator
MRNTLQSVERALRVLTAFESNGQELGVGEIAELLDVHKSTASRLAATLAASGFLERSPASESFRLGPQLARLGVLAFGGPALVEIARKPMEELARTTGETVTFSVRDGNEAVTVAQIDARYLVGVKNWVGGRTPLHCTSDGKVLLAFGGGKLVRRPLQALTARTVTDRTELRRQLEETRRRGWGSGVGEYEDGLNGVAAPVLDAAGRCRAALCVCGPSYRVPEEALRGFAKQCVQATTGIGSTWCGTNERPNGGGGNA